MKIFECKTCGHIEFNAVPEKCLVCRSPASEFAENPAAIKAPANPAALTEGDKKHIPHLALAGRVQPGGSLASQGEDWRCNGRGELQFARQLDGRRNALDKANRRASQARRRLNHYCGRWRH